MKTGSYKGRRVDFQKYSASRFNPHLFAGTFDNMGFGASALALLTGIAPLFIAQENNFAALYADNFVVRLHSMTSSSSRKFGDSAWEE